MAQSGADGWILPLIPYHFTLVQNIKRDPFEQAVGGGQKTVMAFGWCRLASPSTAYQYDWNMLPVGQQLWERHLMSFKSSFRRCSRRRHTTLDAIMNASAERVARQRLSLSEGRAPARISPPPGE